MTFAGPVDPATFTPADVILTGPGGGTITVTDVVLTSVPDANGQNPRNVFELRFAPQTGVGTYNLTVGPNLSDPAGNLMNQNNNQVNGEPKPVPDGQPGGPDAFSASLLLNSTTTVGGIRVEGLDGTLAAGQRDTVTIRATDAGGNTLTGYNGQVQISAPNRRPSRVLSDPDRSGVALAGHHRHRQRGRDGSRSSSGRPASSSWA